MSNFNTVWKLALDNEDERVKQAREEFYPDYWMFAQSGDLDTGTAPRYIVRPKTEAERLLAYWVKPVGVIADIRPAEQAN